MVSECADTFHGTLGTLVQLVQENTWYRENTVGTVGPHGTDKIQLAQKSSCYRQDTVGSVSTLSTDKIQLVHIVQTRYVWFSWSTWYRQDTVGTEKQVSECADTSSDHFNLSMTTLYFHPLPHTNTNTDANTNTNTNTVVTPPYQFVITMTTLCLIYFPLFLIIIETKQMHFSLSELKVQLILFKHKMFMVNSFLQL